MLKIQDFAVLCHCSTQTLRYYDRINLFKPFYIELLTGYRYYKEEQASEFLKIKELQLAGWTIKEIKTLKDKDDDYLLNKMKEKIEIQREQLNLSIELFETYLEKKMKLQNEIEQFTQEHKLQITKQDYLMTISNNEDKVIFPFNTDPSEVVELMKEMQKNALIALNDLSNFHEHQWNCSKVFTDWKNISEFIHLMPRIDTDENRTLIHLFNISPEISLYDIDEVIQSMKSFGYDGEALFYVSLSEDESNSYAIIYSES